MAKKAPNQKSKVTVGYARLPGRTTPGSHASFSKTFTKSVRESMADVVKRFSDLIAGLKNACPDTLETAMLPTFEKAQLYCPKDTGELVSSGDSGSPIFMGINGEAVLLGNMYGQGGQLGVNYGDFISQINAALVATATASGDANPSQYAVKTADLSGFTAY
jgi:hypothetical protein